MKSTRLKKVVKISFFTALILFSSLFIWANLSTSTLTEKLAKIEIKTYDLSKVKNEASFEAIEKNLRNKRGITAFSLNKTSKLVGITYNPKMIESDYLLSDLKRVGGNEIQEKTFPQKAACPVQGATSFIAGIKESLKVR